MCGFRFIVLSRVVPSSIAESFILVVSDSDGDPFS